MIRQINTSYPKLYITEKTVDSINLNPEQDDGHIEYKRTLIHCNGKKIDKYATQMRWRITENVKNQIAIYYIGVDDDGSIHGLTDDNICDCIDRFVIIANKIDASIVSVQIIHITETMQKILKIRVKIKKIYDDCIYDFGEKF